MLFYRGVDQAELLKSINQTLELFENHSSGPALQEQVDALREADPATGISPLGSIAAATTDKDLATALNGTSLGYLFARTSDIITYHALNDTDGKGFDTYASLQKWSATDAVTISNYTSFDAEKDAWLVLQYAERVQLKKHFQSAEANAGNAGSPDPRARVLGPCAENGGWRREESSQA